VPTEDEHGRVFVQWVTAYWLVSTTSRVGTTPTPVAMSVRFAVCRLPANLIRRSDRMLHRTWNPGISS
jgi:hypothetical protein